MAHFNKQGYAKLLADWVAFSQHHLTNCRERPELLVYGAGEHGHWGVHTHQKAFSAFAVAATLPIDWSAYDLSREKVLSQALGMLRYNLASHLTGDFTCVDGEKWGHNWIYVLGVERMMHGVEAIWDDLTPKDKSMLREMLISESDFLLQEYPIKAGLIHDNKPESNIWNGATLYRTAAMYPDAPNADAYREKAARFFANGISIESDENSDETVDGRRVGDMFVGANYYDSYACDHHGYMNVGYMVICLSNIAMLHFSLKAMGAKADDIVYHHLQSLWKLVRTMTYDDGRLLRIGGDSRARYCYCQDYALPSWALIEDVYGEDEKGLEDGWLNILNTETHANGDGSFLSNRFGRFEEDSPVYYTRLESDRANTISMALYWHEKYALDAKTPAEPLSHWETDWHGACYSGAGERHASFVWRASEKPQALCLPKSDSSLAEWRYNLTGHIEGVGMISDEEVLSHEQRAFDGGFLTWGTTRVFSDRFLAEGQGRDNMADKRVAFAALPDGATVLCLQSAVAINRTFVKSAKGVMLSVPNDIFNGCARTFTAEFFSPMRLRGGVFAVKKEFIRAGSYVNADDKLGVASLKPLTLFRPGYRQVEIKGRPDSGTLYAEEIVCGYDDIRRWYDRGDTLIDAAFAVSIGDASRTRAQAESLFTLPGVRSVGVRGADGKRYLLALNDTCAPVAMRGLTLKSLAGDPADKALEPGQAGLYRVQE